MSWWLKHNFDIKRPNLEKRMEIIKLIRSFFNHQEFWEVETPILQIMPTADIHIHGFETTLMGVDLKSQKTLYLQTSPELEMKKLMVAGVEKLFQICKTFRNGENTKLHSAEFTMIEWYRIQASYRDIMEDCVQLMRHIATNIEQETFIYKDIKCDPFKDWQYITVAEAFIQMADIDLSQYLDTSAPAPFAEAIKAQGIRVAADDKWDDLFFRVMAEKIEPHLGKTVPTILYDYPTSMACLACKKQEDPRYAERFELYICGIEIANAFSELTDAQEQRQRFVEDMATKETLYGVSYPLDEDFLKALEVGLPTCSGIALGIDRLIMLCTGADHIEQVLWTAKP